MNEGEAATKSSKHLRPLRLNYTNRTGRWNFHPKIVGGKYRMGSTISWGMDASLRVMDNISVGFPSLVCPYQTKYSPQNTTSTSSLMHHNLSGLLIGANLLRCITMDIPIERYFLWSDSLNCRHAIVIDIMSSLPYHYTCSTAYDASLPQTDVRIE